MTSYSVINQWKGYRHKTDVTNMEPGVLVVGSKNVILNDGERVQLRRGYSLDGDANSASTPIESSFDWVRHLGDERNLRSYGDELEYRYVDSAGTVTWRRLADGFTSAEFNYAVFWDSTELIERLLFVNGTSNIFDWSGGVTTLASATAATITKSGTDTWAQEGFYTTGTRQVTINGTVYTYTGGESSTTLTGVTPDPSGEAAGSVIHQTIRTTANTSMTTIPATFANSLIAVYQNQVFIGSFVNHSVYVSQQNSFTVYTQASPRTPGSGMLITLDGPPTAFISQEDQMYISAGQDFWYEIGLQLSDDNTKEAVAIKRLKTTSLQAARSQAAVSKIKNSVVYISFEPTFDTLGRVELIQTPQTEDLSDPIKLDFDSYDFTNCSVAYHRDYVYIAIPANGIVLVRNLRKTFWEAPQTIPVSRFSIIGGELYGQSSTQPETYKLFDGTSDNGQAIEAVAKFSYINGGKRANLKNATEWYTEGYMSTNTELYLRVYFDYQGATSISEFELLGTNTNIVLPSGVDGSLGKHSLGKFSLAGRGTTNDGILTRKFRALSGTSKTDFYEAQIEYYSVGVDMAWELVATGSDIMLSTAKNAKITL